MDCSTRGFLVHHQLLELVQTHVHRVSDAIQTSHSLSSPSSPAFNLSQRQGLFQWVSSSHQEVGELVALSDPSPCPEFRKKHMHTYTSQSKINVYLLSMHLIKDDSAHLNVTTRRLVQAVVKVLITSLVQFLEWLLKNMLHILCL